jgi:hypothetical protein
MPKNSPRSQELPGVVSRLSQHHQYPDGKSLQQDREYLGAHQLPELYVARTRVAMHGDTSKLLVATSTPNPSHIRHSQFIR